MSAQMNTSQVESLAWQSQDFAPVCQDLQKAYQTNGSDIFQLNESNRGSFEKAYQLLSLPTIQSVIMKTINGERSQRSEQSQGQDVEVRSMNASAGNVQPVAHKEGEKIQGNS